jgi:hypothetical protein
MMILQWRMPEPAIVLRWRGAGGGVAPALLANPALSVPTIIGPPGPPGPAFEIATAVIDGGTFN